MNVQRRAFLNMSATGAAAVGLSLLGAGQAVAAVDLRGTAPAKPFASTPGRAAAAR